MLVYFFIVDWVIIIVFVLVLVVILWGLIMCGWYMVEIGFVFLVLGLFFGIVGCMGISGMVDSFVEGCKEFVYVVVVIGFVCGILVVVENG